MIEFEFEDDRAYFATLLCSGDESLESFADLFDFRSPHAKRAEFDRIKTAAFNHLLGLHGRTCMLAYAPDCDVARGLVLDHIIPLSSNKLNKCLRGFGTSRDGNGGLRKVPTQSWGSNNPGNLVLACVNCNSLKQNRILDRVAMRKMLQHSQEIAAAAPLVESPFDEP